MIESGYFAELGVNALWLTPFNEAASGTGEAADGIHDVSVFHGYWPTEARSIEPRLGTEEQLHEMVNAAHDNGIRIMMDFVVNHVHEQHHYYQDNPLNGSIQVVFVELKIVIGLIIDLNVNSHHICQI